jgi:CarD family transcriptional regulator
MVIVLNRLGAIIGIIMPQTNPSKKNINKKKKEDKKMETTNKELKWEFQVNDYIVYPAQGVGKIIAIENIKLGNKKKPYYIINIFDKSLTVKIPVDNIKASGIRPIIKKTEVKKVLKILEEEQDELEEDWKIRYQNNLNKIKSGSIFEIATVCRNLYKRARDKELSLMERRLYETAYTLVTEEIAIAKEIPLEEAKNLVSELLSKQ